MIVRDYISVRADNNAAACALGNILTEESGGGDGLRCYLDNGVFNRRNDFCGVRAARNGGGVNFGFGAFVNDGVAARRCLRTARCAVSAEEHIRTADAESR